MYTQADPASRIIQIRANIKIFGRYGTYLTVFDANEINLEEEEPKVLYFTLDNFCSFIKLNINHSPGVQPRHKHEFERKEESTKLYSEKV